MTIENKSQFSAGEQHDWRGSIETSLMLARIRRSTGRLIVGEIEMDLPENGLVYLSADQHLWHRNIVKYQERPWTADAEGLDQMTAALIAGQKAG